MLVSLAPCPDRLCVGCLPPPPHSVHAPAPPGPPGAGALATLAAYDVGLRLARSDEGSIRKTLEKEGVKVRKTIHVSAITFAAPRVGNPEFKAAVRRAGVKVLRVVNLRDVVPLVPGECWQAARGKPMPADCMHACMVKCKRACLRLGFT
jgi:hypothetical protein